MKEKENAKIEECPKCGSSNFITDIIDEDNKSGRYGERVHTRFPPEPNGYLHIGHAKSICLNFGLAERYSGLCNLRFDDTNPSKEENEFIESIIEDVRWLGFDWQDRLFFASDYFEKLYECSEKLIMKGRAYVCDLTAEQVRDYRGTLTSPGRESPFRNREAEENLDLFRRMRKGDFKDGQKTLRAKIDMSSPNINMRDPVIYRIMRTHHPRTNDDWCIYPMYDYAHCISDSIEGITHSVCTLEFEDHRPLYEWFLEQLDMYKPRQIEFARLNLTFTVMSKRKLGILVEKKLVSGWDDPRMPTIAGLRRRGYTPDSVKTFCEKIGVAKRESTVDYSLLEHCLREELNLKAKRVMCVLDPLKLIIDNYEDGKVEYINALNNPEDEKAGTRELAFSKVLYIERSDFEENPPPKYYRLSPGREVRLKHAYYVVCKYAVKNDDTGEVEEIHCDYDSLTKGGSSEDKRKVEGTIHWVSQSDCLDTEVRLYDRLFKVENPSESTETGDFTLNIDQNSLVITKNSKIESSVGNASPGEIFQFLRNGYFCVDKDSSVTKLVFNRSVSLKDSWTKILKKLDRK